MRVLVPVLLFSYLLSCVVAPAVSAAGGEESDCAICHEEVAAAFQRTTHAVAPGWEPSTACQSCHGPGDAHIEGEGDPEAIIRPQLLSPRESSDGCLTCHRRQEKHFSGLQAVHRLDDVGCVDCHNPHSATENMLAKTGSDLCAECHAAVVAEFELPRSHPLGEGGRECASCHDPHGTGSLRVSRHQTGEACGQCHFEKVGPFIYGHDTLMVDGCAACHEVHGSPNRHLLRHATQVNLCYECHSASVTPGWHSTSRFLNEKCTACHTAIHGSNTNQFFLEE